MKIRKITNFKTNKWSGGKTTEMFIYPKSSNYEKRNFLFRLSSATVEVEQSLFSNLKGYKRFIAPLSGELNISHNEKDYKKLKLNELYQFDGGIKTISKGKCSDFNLIAKNDTNVNIKNITLNKETLFSIELKFNEIFWIFLHNNFCEFKIYINNKLTEVFNLQQKNLFVFNEEHTQQVTKNTISILTNKNANLFYGSIQISK